jgi:heterodisulfide reductase subunit D
VFDMEQEIKETNIRLCLDCGKCTVVCPIAQYDPEFNPRLIAKRGITRSNKQAWDETIWACLSCYMCVERCNYHVKFPRFVHALRAEALAEGAPVSCSHGGSLHTLMRMMSRENLKQKRLEWLPKDIKLSETYDTLFFVGCAPYFDAMFKDLEINTLNGVKGALKLLNHAGIPFNLSAGERCCGRDLLLQGDRNSFMALAHLNIQEFEDLGVKRIITNCPECYYTLKVDYPDMVKGFGIEVLHLTEVIAPLVQSRKLNLRKLDKRVTYQDPCTLGRCARIFDQPRHILKAAGLELVEMEQSREKALCCGATAWLRCGAVNRQVQKQRLAQAEASGAEMLVTACPKCQIHLRCAQKSDKGSSRVEILDLASLAAQSLD